MWLRDLLPTTTPFDQARIMTFGYNSKIVDKSSLSGLKEWADDLLSRLSSVRTSDEVSMPFITIIIPLPFLILAAFNLAFSFFLHLR
jgi:hypothetical protein